MSIITILLFFAVGTLVEMLGLVWISSSFIGSLNMISITMFSFLIGIVVGRAYGNVWFDKIQWHLKSGTLPEDEIVDGCVMNLASMMLLTPGIFSDFIGFIIITPVTRGPFKALVLWMMKKKIARGEPWFFFKDAH